MSHHEAQVRPAFTSEQDTLTEQEIQELIPEASHGEVDAEVEQEMEGETEAEYSTEWIAHELLESIEGHGAGPEAAITGRLLARFCLRQTVKTVLLYNKAIVKRMVRNAMLKKKLQMAVRRGPRAVNRLVGGAILGAMPRPFRRACRKLVMLAVRASFRQIGRNAGLNPNEIDVAELEKDHMAGDFGY